MSIPGFAEPMKMSKKSSSSHWKNDSGELDVFEAARYFSDVQEVSGYNNNGCSSLAQRIMRDDRQPWRGGRISLDMPNIRNSLHTSQTFVLEKPSTTAATKEKKFKQPSSPGGRLASFLNSLFNQSSSRKKKSKSSAAAVATTQSLRDEDESPGGGGRRRRRSSISHFWITSSNNNNTNNNSGGGDNNSKTSIFQSSNSGFRTPPPYSITPTKSYKDLQSFINHQQVLSMNRAGGDKKQGIYTSEKKQHHHHHHQEYERSRLSSGSCSEKFKSVSSKFSERGRTSWADQYLSEEKENFRKFNDHHQLDDGGDSDSSSDLFELPNYDLDCYSSSGLPVYETTNVESIKKSATISSETTR